MEYAQEAVQGKLKDYYDYDLRPNQLDVGVFTVL